MAREVHRSTLGDYFTLQRGTTYKSRLLGQPGPVLLGLATIQRNGGFRRDALQTYGGDSPDKLIVQPGELYLSLKDVTQSADLLGAVARLPRDHAPGRLTQDTVKLEPKGAGVPLAYLYWLLRTPQYRGYCRSHATGTTNLGLARGDFLAFPAPEPKAMQLRIVETLGTLDDKIELNRRMNETLEALARALFKSWFVDFDPVRAKMDGRDPGLPKSVADLFPARLVESELGKIPEGWAVEAIGEHIINFDSKRVPVSGAERAKRRGPYPYHGAAGVMDCIDDYLFDGTYLLVGEDGSVVREAGLAVTQYVGGKIWVNNHAHVLQGKGEVSTEQILLYFHFEPVAAYVTGAVQPKLSQGRMNLMPFVFAGERVCRAFAYIAQPWFARLRANADEAKTLAALRDALLPKLLSGEIRVSPEWSELTVGNCT